LAAGDPRLKVRDGGDGQKDIVTPAGYHRITLNNCVTMCFEELQESPFHLRQGVTLSDRRIAYEGVLIARCIAAGFSVRVKGPEDAAAGFASLAIKSLVLEKGDSVDVPQVRP